MSIASFRSNNTIMETHDMMEATVKGLSTALFLILIVASLLELSLLSLRPLLLRIGKKTGLNGGIELILGLVLGILLASWLDLDVFSMTFNVESNWLGVALTGAVIGQGGTWLIRILPRIRILSSIARIPGEPPRSEEEQEEKEE